MKILKLTKEDMHNLYDLMMMVNWVDYKTLELNKMDEWFEKFYYKLEKLVIPEIYKGLKEEQTK